MPPQEDPPVDRIYPDDPALLLRDLEELPPVTTAPARRPLSKTTASQPKGAPRGETTPPPAKHEPDHFHPPDPGIAPPPHPRTDTRDEIRTTSHRVMGSRESQRPVERTNQNRKHGRHAGPRESKPEE